MNFDKDNLLGLLGVVVIVGSIFLVFYGIKVVEKKEDKPPIAETQKQQEEKSNSTSTQDKEGEEPITHTVATSNEPSSQPSSQPSAGGSSVVLGPSEPATAPSEEDITRVEIASSTCNPKSLQISGEDRIILEIVSQDDDYIFLIVDTPITEEIEKGTSKRISFSSSMINSPEAEFECRLIKENEN